ncbi:MAG: preprotein translocase subunit SecG [Nitrospinae bacterium]|nr:preprotein translocase subunit SecG [Nitrospinota bacterium]
MFSGLVTTLHVIVAFVMIIVVLLQSGKGAGLGSGFGGSSQTVFGSRGPASFLSKFTTASAVIFMITSLMLSVISTKVGKSSIADEIQSKQKATTGGTTTADPFKAVHDAQQQGLPAATTAQPGQPAPLPLQVAPTQPLEQKGSAPAPDKKP